MTSSNTAAAPNTSASPAGPAEGAAASAGLPLSNLRIVELAGIGPGPHAAMMLADHGAQIIRVERADPATAGASGSSTPESVAPPPPARDVSLRGRRIVRADLKDPDDLGRVRSLITAADVLIEGFRPGVTERLGLGPDDMLAANPGLVYGRMTGWGQDGPEAPVAGHDLNYISRTGLLHLIGDDPARGPVPPLNLVGDFGGGSMFLVTGILLALLERERTGRGQVVDAAIVDGTATLGASIWGKIGTGGFRDDRGTNSLDGSAPFYRCYVCRDGLHLSLAAIERRFFDIVTDTLGLEPWPEEVRLDPARWPQITAVLAGVFAGRDRADWLAAFAGTDACIAPVRTMSEAPDDEHMRAREVYVDVDGAVQPRPAPRLSNHGLPTPPPLPTEVDDLESLARDWGV